MSFSIYGAMLMVLYIFSTLYHSVRGRAKDVLRKFDHCAIYLLIAGSYTPVRAGDSARCLGLALALALVAVSPLW